MGLGLRRVLYAATVFAGALLLFLVQPVMARAILPWFGGTAGVWTTSMLFFQALLLLGYLYAHLVTRRLGPRPRALLHAGLLAASLALLPIAPGTGWKPHGSENPVPAILGLLAATVGLPYFLLAATTPLVQTWYAAAGAVPYRLFAVSNLASLGALLAYPLLAEPLLPLGRQMRAWSAAYAGFALLCGACAVSAPHKTLPPGDGAASWRDRLLWMALAACPAALWMAVGNQLSQNVAPVPFLWILPLSLYLLSFVLTFDRPGWYSPALYRWLLPAAWAAIVVGLQQAHGKASFVMGLLLYGGALLVVAMFCHGELARRKPSPGALTSYYLMIAAGGAVGGAFVALVAPYLFDGYLELPVAMVASVLLAVPLLYAPSVPVLRLARLAVVAAAGFALALHVRASLGHHFLRARNFYGALELADGKGPNALRTLYNGSIIHGTQFLDPARAGTPTAYYGPHGGGGVAMRYRQGKGLRAGVIGLGVGTLAAYGRPGDSLRFYEINPLVTAVARGAFRFLRDCPAQVEVAHGDARLTLEREPPQNFDLLVVDAFSGDAIPVHLLTREAFAVYWRHLAPGGVLAVHVTNNYLDLLPVVKAAADAFHKPALLLRTPGDAGNVTYGSDWVLMSDDAAFLRYARAAGAIPAVPRRPARLWTDDHSGILRLLR